MTTRTLLLPLVLAALLVTAVPAAPAAAAKDHASTVAGVTATRSGERVVFRFAADARAARSAYRKIAGKRAWVRCVAGSRPRPDALTRFAAAGYADLRVPKRRAALRARLRGTGGQKPDVCWLYRASDDELIAWVSVTTAGDVFIDEQWTAAMLAWPLALLPELPTTATELVVAGDGDIVALASPDASPPPEKVGYWTDGTRAVLVAVTAEGRRLFWETEGDVVRTNALSLLNV